MIFPLSYFFHICIFLQLQIYRKDLANIVRRRGHKLIKQFLVNPSETESDGNGSLKNLNGDSQEKRDYKETGQFFSFVQV